MKYIFCIVLFILFFACGKNPPPKEVEEKVDKEEFLDKIEKKKTSKIEQDTSWNWLGRMYPNVRKKYGDEIVETQSVEKYAWVNDSISWCILAVQSYGVCSKKYLTVHSNKKEIKEEEMASGCDQDFSQPKYEWKNYEQLKPNVFVVRNFIESVPKEYVGENGMIKSGYNFEDLETTIDTIVQVLRIHEDGSLSFEKVTEDYPLWLHLLYPENLTVMDDMVLEYQTIFDYAKMNDSVSWCLVGRTVHAAAEFTDFVLLKNKEEIERMEISVSSGCGFDEEIVEWSTFEKLSNEDFMILNMTQITPNDSGGETEMIDTTIEYFKIAPTGIVEKIKY